MENLKRNPKWTWRNDVKYHLVVLPIEIIRAICGILNGDHKLNQMGWREYIDLAYGIADMKCGRWYSNA